MLKKKCSRLSNIYRNIVMHCEQRRWTISTPATVAAAAAAAAAATTPGKVTQIVDASHYTRCTKKTT